MTIKELVELNFCIAEIEVEVRSNGRLKAKYYIGDGAWRNAKLREHEAHQDYKVEFIAEKINRFENDHVYHDVILKNIPKKILKMEVYAWQMTKKHWHPTNSDSFEAIEVTVEVPENYDLPPMQEEKELEGQMDINDVFDSEGRLKWQG